MQTVTEDGEIIDVTQPQVAILEPPFFKTPWNHDTDAESDRTALECKDPSKTKQEFAKEADINNILAKFLNTGELTTTGIPKYMDVENEFDLQDQIVTAHQVETAWQELPAAVRNILKDPRTFADYVEHCLETGDLDPLRELGLAKPRDPAQAITGGTSTPVPPKEPPAPKEPDKGSTTAT